MDEKKFILKNSILLTLCIFVIVNLPDLLLFKFHFNKNNNSLISIIVWIIILSIIIYGIYIKRKNEEFNPIIKYLEFIQADDTLNNYSKTFENMSIIGFFIILLFSISFVIFTVLIYKTVKFNAIQNIVLFLFTISLVFLFFKLLLTSIMNIIKKTNIDTTLPFYFYLFFIVFIVHCSFCYYYYSLQKKREKKKKNQTIE